MGLHIALVTSTHSNISESSVVSISMVASSFSIPGPAYKEVVKRYLAGHDNAIYDFRTVRLRTLLSDLEVHGWQDRHNVVPYQDIYIVRHRYCPSP
jgi:hypothetical protein